MAFRPSQRSLRPKEEADPNLTPVMNLMVVLIPLLLTSAQFIRLGMIEINLPPAMSASALQNMPKETEKRLDLTVTVTDAGFYLASSLAVARGSDGKGPSVPKLEDGSYDFAKLGEDLYKIKKRAEGVFPDADRVIIVAEPEIDYQTVVSTMDAARSFKIENMPYPLFPTVSLSATVM